MPELFYNRNKQHYSSHTHNHLKADHHVFLAYASLITCLAIAFPALIISCIALNKDSPQSGTTLSSHPVFSNITFSNVYLNDIIEEYPTITIDSLSVSISYSFESNLTQGSDVINQASPLKMKFVRIGDIVTINIHAWVGNNCTTLGGSSLRSVLIIPTPFIPTKNGNTTLVSPETIFQATNNGTPLLVIFSISQLGYIHIDSFESIEFNGQVEWNAFSSSYSYVYVND